MKNKINDKNILINKINDEIYMMKNYIKYLIKNSY